MSTISIAIAYTNLAKMDQFNINPDQAEGLQNMSAKDRQDLNQFVMNETQKAQIQASKFSSFQDLSSNANEHPAIHSLTDTCFKKCITSKIASGKLDRYEEPCMQNCVDRYMDANMTVIRHLEQMRQL